MSPVIGAVDIGGSKIAIGLVTRAGDVCAHRELPSAPLCEAGLTGLEQVCATLREMAQAHGTTLCGLGIACTGPIDSNSGVIGDVATIPGWNGLNLRDAFSSFSVSIGIENDADASALAEAAWGAGAGASRFLYVTISTGIGCGLVFDGVLYRGAGGAHPEIGHHILDMSGPKCYCGAHGCWEVLASGPALVAAYAQHSGQSDLTASDVCALARTGDADAAHATQHVAGFLGAGLSNLITIFAPDTIALGGGLMRSWDLFEQRAMNVIRRCCTQVPLESTRIVSASLGERLPVLGGARAWIQQFDQDSHEQHR